MINQSHVGKKVKLNNDGIEQIWGKGCVSSMQHMKTLQMTITEMSSVSLCAPETLFEVRVDNPEIDAFMIDNWCFDPIE